jgi:putative aldouronate transport system permease protein
VLNPTVVPVFSAIILMNFFRTLPQSLSESAMMDGASHFTILARIYLPLSMASVATLILFSMVMQWNEWFMGLIYLSDPSKYPLQTRLQQMVVTINIENLTKEEIELMDRLSNRSFKAAQIIVSTVPILCVYPFLQKYFVKGIILGAIKG